MLVGVNGDGAALVSMLVLSEMVEVMGFGWEVFGVCYARRGGAEFGVWMGSWVWLRLLLLVRLPFFPTGLAPYELLPTIPATDIHVVRPESLGSYGGIPYAGTTGKKRICDLEPFF